MLHLASSVGLLALGALAAPSDTWTIHAGPARSWVILGSEEFRSGWVVGLQRSRPEKRLNLFKTPLLEVVEVYGETTKGGPVFEFGANYTRAIGALYLMRRSTPRDRSSGMFAEIGLGLQLADKPTYDLNSTANFTPTGGVGGWFQVGGSTIQVTLRGMHISNGGLAPPNRGQNQFQLLFGYRF